MIKKIKFITIIFLFLTIPNIVFSENDFFQDGKKKI